MPILCLVNAELPIDVVVFARSPVLGQVKRRLSRDIGPRHALSVYRKLFRHTLREVHQACASRPGMRAVLYHLGPFPERDIPRGVSVLAKSQTGPTMNENLAALLECPKSIERKGVIVVGADHPLLRSADICDLALELEQNEVVLGRAEDGGFWGLATRVALGDIMLEIPLGGPETCAALEERLVERGLRYGVGTPLFDVDTLEDVRRWKKVLSG